MTTSTSAPGLKSVIVVGAGPAGLLMSLLLAKQGIPVQLLDSGSTLDRQPRATHYGPPAVYELARAGVVEEVRARGFTPKVVCWRKNDGTYLAGLDGSVLDGAPDRLICLPLDQLGEILHKHIMALPKADLKWNHKVTGLGQDDQKAWVEIETPEGPKRLEAEYVIGCDGANSQVRRSLFGDMNFPGRTWDEQIVATNTYYDFNKFGYEDANFIIDREHWHMASRITNDGLWRVTYGEKPGKTREQLFEELPAKFEAILPGHPKPEQYKVANFSPYKVHQRLAEKMRVGRFLLAADAAHLCNPFGGLGLTGGIVDVGGLFDCLIGIHNGVANDSILDKYDEIRRQKYLELIDPISTENIRRLFDQDPDKAMETDEFLKLCKKTETDEAFSREFQNGVNGIKYDFTQHYLKELENGDFGVGAVAP
ncbi:FAD/NAD(P)-binding domain-containing protein [Cadophora sp. DSE1049]|nr:FAD/NAD(P)-binding domain-containing protein [Cadophora sp. DSE1049]